MFNLTEKLIILDRDGVINYDSVNYIRSPEEWIPIPGSLDAIARLNQAGFRIAVATNQSGIARGYYTEETLDAMHQKMQRLLSEKNGHVDVIFHCPHLPSEPHLPSSHCECRKPKPGMLKKIAEYFNCKLDGVPFIGDSLTDVEAAIAANATPVFITDTNTPLQNCISFKNLAAAVDAILKEYHKGNNS